jgi:hypothetical protein
VFALQAVPFDVFDPLGTSIQLMYADNELRVTRTVGERLVQPVLNIHVRDGSEFHN